MTRFTIIAALVVVMMAIAVAEASSFSNHHQSERCRSELQGVQMNECMRYLERSQRGLLAMTTNPQMPPQECCQAMRDVSEECRCEAVRQMMQQMQQGQQHHGEQMQEMMQKAKQLPGMCGMSPQSCRISTRDVEEDNINTQTSEKCRREVQGVQMSPCMRYLEQSQRSDPMMPPQQCCQAMRDVSEECRCEAVRQMMQQMQQGQQYQGEQMQEMMEKARQLPGMCGMSPRSCRTSTFDVEEDINTQTSEKCRREVQGVQMNPCMRYLEQSQRGSYNPHMPPQQCCQAMREVSEECRCEAVRQMMQQMQQGHQYQGEQMQEMMEKARQLPGMCGMSPQSCRISTRDVEEDNINTQTSEKCRREVQGVQMSPCMRYLEQSQRTDPMRPPQQCCQAMREMSEECRCEAVRQMMQQMQQGHQYQGEQMQEMMEKARQLPGMCGMSPQSCRMSGQSSFY